MELNTQNLAKQISQDVDAFCVEAFSSGFRNHLGASHIGKRCSRLLWYQFRWTFKENNDGRKLRLFDRGHREEERFINYLEGIGCTVEAFDTSKEPNEKGEYPQFKITGSKGHFGGSLDAIIKLPERYGVPFKLLGEFKTKGTGAGFNKLVSSGMRLEAPEHFAQTSTYGSDPNYNFEYCLYMSVNKNDDSLHIEVVKLDFDLGNRMRDKADRIIFSDKPPHKISPNPSHFECAYCPANALCHKGAIPEKNCRSCKYASPVEDANWQCEKFGAVIPKDFIKTGCDNWLPVTANK